MQNPATKDDALRLLDYLAERLPIQAEINGPKNRNWTTALHEVLEAYVKAISEDWKMLPPEPCERGGRAKGEFLLDFVALDPKLGPRIVCESQWGDLIEDLDWAFDKLRAVKGDIKLFVFEGPYTDVVREEYIFRCLSQMIHHEPGREHYILLRFTGNRPMKFYWTPPHCGPIDPKEVTFEFIP